MSLKSAFLRIKNKTEVQKTLKKGKVATESVEEAQQVD